MLNQSFWLEGFVPEGQEDKVYLLKKALYELKQALRVWYSRIDDHLSDLGFQKSPSASTLYIKYFNSDIIIISLYVDDLLVRGSNVVLIEELKKEIMKVFEMTDLREMAFFLGMEVKQIQDQIFICQKKYAKEIQRKFRMDNCKSMSMLKRRS
ncbi:hypothetical protein RDI58_022496 [Solanum bulbocastanum]|uniref:Reverse transcriptase Ty1/copia-type domain-containing protein n=1 Tax=Solanum bulbocastanum TaxID=147425 RepID=A0AAN8Y5U1_SOLBU